MGTLSDDMVLPSTQEREENKGMLSLKEVAGICRMSYVTVWRLARERGKLTSYKSLGMLRVDSREVHKELWENLRVNPDGERPGELIKPGEWLSIKEAAEKLGAQYQQVYHHVGDFTRTRFHGKILIYRGDLGKGMLKRCNKSRVSRLQEIAEQGVRMRG